MEGGTYAETAWKNDFIAIGWNELGDLSWILGKDSEEEVLTELKDLYRKTYPDEVDQAVSLCCSQVISFVLRMNKGDIVITPSNNEIMIGEIKSDYYYDDPPRFDCEYKNRRNVKWISKKERSSLPERLRSSLFAWQAVFNLDKHGELIQELIEGKTKPVEQMSVGSDVIEILQKRLLELDPASFQEKLVPAILKAMGFETETSPTYKRDGGIDVSGRFRMGLFTGDVRVQVKRVEAPVAPQIIRELRGSLQHGQQGVLITTSDFTEQAKKEAMDSTKAGGRIFLVNGRELSELILETYDALEEEVKEELEKRFGLKKTFVIFRN